MKVIVSRSRSQEQKRVCVSCSRVACLSTKSCFEVFSVAHFSSFVKNYFFASFVKFCLTIVCCAYCPDKKFTIFKMKT